MKLAAYRVELPAPTHLEERLEVPGKRATEHPKELLFSRHLEVACDRRRDGEIFCQPELAYHLTLKSATASGAEDPPRRRGLARQRPEAPQPGLLDLHRPALKSKLS